MADLVTLGEVLAHLNMADDPPGDVHEIELFIDAATAHLDHRYGALPSGSYVELLEVVDDGAGPYRWWLVPHHSPLTAVISAVSEDGSITYSDGFTIAADGRRVRHDDISSAAWTLTYSAGHSVPADLRLAVLEDIRGLYQPGQIGPPAEFGAFGVDADSALQARRPLNLWPRIDAWVDSRLGPAIA